MNEQQPLTTSKKTSVWESIKNAFTKSPHEVKIFPWYQSGILILGFSLGVLVTASVYTFTATPLSSETTLVSSSKEDECVNSGGRYDDKNQICLLVTNDRGNTCTDSSDCQGWCSADENAKIGTGAEGICGESFNKKGCFKFIDKGKVNSICIP